MNKPKPMLMPLAVAAAAGLCGIITFMIADRASILRDGREVVLTVEPIDPRDLLRGRYVRMGFEARQVPVKDAQARMEQFEQNGDDKDVYVLFERAEDGSHKPVDAVLERPTDGLFIAAKALTLLNARNDKDGFVTVDYGMGRFYTDEHRAPLLETRMREGEITTIIAAVDAKGRPQIKALRQGDDVIVTEPLY